MASRCISLIRGCYTGGELARCEVSVIIPAHIKSRNDRNLLDIQLRGLERQDYIDEFEVIVADNRSAENIKDYIASHPLRESLKLRYADASEFKGAAHARNVGAEVAIGNYLLFCDHDDLVKPNWISRLAAFLDEGYDLASSAVEGLTLNSSNPRGLAAIPPPELFQPAHVFAPVVVGASMACRTEMYHKLGGMDVAYTANEDVAFGWMAHQEGYRIGFLAEALVAYRYRSGFIAGWRQGVHRGIGLARLNDEFPDNGLPSITTLELLPQICRIALLPRLTGEERGLLMGLGAGRLIGGHHYRTIRRRHS